MTTQWVLAASLAAVLFGIGDFLVVKTEKDTSVLTVFLAYSIIIGVGCSIILAFKKDGTTVMKGLIEKVGLKTLLAIALLHFLAYLLHFYAIQNATNPGYANALVMFHVAVLALLSWQYLRKPLSRYGILGILTMFIGAFIVVNAS